MGTAIRLVVPGRLAFADRQRASVRARSLEHAERDRVDVGDSQSSRVGGDGGEVRRRLEATEEVRLLEDHARRVAHRSLELVGVDRPVPVRHLDDIEPEARGVGFDHLAHLRVERLGEHDLRAAGRVLRDVARVGGNGGAVVPRSVRDVHAGQLADRGLVLEDRLQHALAHLGLVGRVRGEELAALQNGVDDRGHVVVVDPGAEEGELDRVLRRQLLEVPGQLDLRKLRPDVEVPAEPHRLRNVAEELVDRADADRLEHRLPVGVREREVGARHSSANSFAYSPASSSESTSTGLASRIRINQPPPYGSSFTVSGSSTTF